MLPKNNTVQYDDFGETFWKSRLDLRWEEIDEILAHFITRAPSTGLIADVGCGNGRLLRHIREHESTGMYRKNFQTYIWLDTSEVLLNQAKVQDWWDVFSEVDWRVADMRDIGSELSPVWLFDGVFFIASFHHLQTHEERISVLQQSKKLLSKTGEIVMTNWNLTHPSQSKYKDKKIAEYPDGSADYMIKIGQHERFYHAFSHEEYLLLAQEAGLEISDTFGERNSVVFWS